MEFLAGLYTLLLVTICLLLAAVLWKLNKPRNGGDYEELKRWMQQQLDAQAKDFAARQAAMAEQNYTAIRSVSETLQTSVQSMSTTLAQGQSGQQQILTQRLQSLEAANTQKLEELRKTLAENMTALQAENAKKLDEIRHTVDEQLQDALQKRVTESFKAVNDQLEQVYKGLGEMQNLAADVGGLKQVLSGVKTRGILGEIQLGARSVCPSTPNSPAIPTRTCRMPRPPAMRRRWRMPAMRWSWCCGARQRTSGKSMWSRPTPRPLASSSCLLKDCTPRW